MESLTVNIGIVVIVLALYEALVAVLALNPVVWLIAWFEDFGDRIMCAMIGEKD